MEISNDSLLSAIKSDIIAAAVATEKAQQARHEENIRRFGEMVQLQRETNGRVNELERHRDRDFSALKRINERLGEHAHMLGDLDDRVDTLEDERPSPNQRPFSLETWKQRGIAAAAAVFFAWGFLDALFKVFGILQRSGGL